MAFSFHTLTETFLRSHVQDFIDMARRNIDDEYWGVDQFMSSMNRKWQLSFYVSNEKFPLMGFLVASEKEQSVHIHKFVVDTQFQSKGLGAAMLNHLKEKSIKPLTLKVDQQNEKAVSFYKRHGFSIQAEEKNMYSMILIF